LSRYTQSNGVDFASLYSKIIVSLLRYLTTPFSERIPVGFVMKVTMNGSCVKVWKEAAIFLFNLLPRQTTGAPISTAGDPAKIRICYLANASPASSPMIVRLLCILSHLYSTRTHVLL
jgi:hypothetical protein